MPQAHHLSFTSAVQSYRHGRGLPPAQNLACRGGDTALVRGGTGLELGSIMLGCIFTMLPEPLLQGWWALH